MIPISIVLSLVPYCSNFYGWLQVRIFSLSQVMKAINQNDKELLRSALSCAPRGARAEWVLTISVAVAEMVSDGFSHFFFIQTHM